MPGAGPATAVPGAPATAQPLCTNIAIRLARVPLAALTDRQAVLFRPGPDATQALAARRSPPGPAGLGTPGPAGVLEERRELLAERAAFLALRPIS